MAQSRQVWSGFADGIAPAQRLVGLIWRHGDGYPPSKTVPVPDGPEPCSAPAGTFAFLPSDTPSLLTLRSPHRPLPGRRGRAINHPLSQVPRERRLPVQLPAQLPARQRGHHPALWKDSNYSMCVIRSDSTLIATVAPVAPRPG